MELKDYIKKHEALFPKATLETQLAKLEEEYNELKNATSLKQRHYESIDCLVCMIGIARFNFFLYKRLLPWYVRGIGYYSTFDLEYYKEDLNECFGKLDNVLSGAIKKL